jgi:hypothetical protein
MFRLDHIVPWGRSFDEYCGMFALTDLDLSWRILGCADGPASFNAWATRRGARVISCDPIYRFDALQIEQRITATADQVLEQTRLNANEYVWETIRSVEELAAVRMQAMRDFLHDYPDGKAAGRYVDAELPRLLFADASFDLVLCSHFLFLYTTHLERAFHEAAIRDMCRVAAEVRIFPLLTLDGHRSACVNETTDALGRSGFQVWVENVPYEFQRGGNQMLRISH